jgi:hypothetical protein
VGRVAFGPADALLAGGGQLVAVARPGEDHLEELADGEAVVDAQDLER